MATIQAFEQVIADLTLEHPTAAAGLYSDRQNKVSPLSGAIYEVIEASPTTGVVREMLTAYKLGKKQPDINKAWQDAVSNRTRLTSIMSEFKDQKSVMLFYSASEASPGLRRMYVNRTYAAVEGKEQLDVIGTTAHPFGINTDKMLFSKTLGSGIDEHFNNNKIPDDKMLHFLIADIQPFNQDAVDDMKQRYHDRCIVVFDSKNNNNYALFPDGTLRKNDIIMENVPFDGSLVVNGKAPVIISYTSRNIGSNMGFGEKSEEILVASRTTLSDAIKHGIARARGIMKTDGKLDPTRMVPRTLFLIGGEDLLVNDGNGGKAELGYLWKEAGSNEAARMKVIKAYVEVTKQNLLNVQKANNIQVATETIHNKAFDLIDVVIMMEKNEEVLKRWNAIRQDYLQGADIVRLKESRNFQNSDIVIMQALDFARKSVKEYFSKTSPGYQELSTHTKEIIDARLGLNRKVMTYAEAKNINELEYVIRITHSITADVPRQFSGSSSHYAWISEMGNPEKIGVLKPEPLAWNEKKMPQTLEELAAACAGKATLQEIAERFKKVHGGISNIIPESGKEHDTQIHPAALDFIARIATLSQKQEEAINRLTGIMPKEFGIPLLSLSRTGKENNNDIKTNLMRGLELLSAMSAANPSFIPHYATQGFNHFASLTNNFGLITHLLAKVADGENKMPVLTLNKRQWSAIADETNEEPFLIQRIITEHIGKKLGAFQPGHSLHKVYQTLKQDLEERTSAAMRLDELSDQENKDFAEVRAAFSRYTSPSISFVQSLQRVFSIRQDEALHLAMGIYRPRGYHHAPAWEEASKTVFSLHRGLAELFGDKLWADKYMMVDDYLSPELGDMLFERARITNIDRNFDKYTKTVAGVFHKRQREAEEETASSGIKYYTRDLLTFADLSTILNLDSDKKRKRAILEALFLNQAYKGNDQTVMRNSWKARAAYSFYVKRAVSAMPLRFLTPSGEYVQTRTIFKELSSKLPAGSKAREFYEALLNLSLLAISGEERKQSFMVNPLMVEEVAKRMRLKKEDAYKLIGIMPGTRQEETYERLLTQRKVNIATSPQDHQKIDQQDYLIALGLTALIPGTSLSLNEIKKVRVHDVPLEYLTLPLSGFAAQRNNYFDFNNPGVSFLFEYQVQKVKENASNVNLSQASLEEKASEALVEEAKRFAGLDDDAVREEVRWQIEYVTGGKLPFTIDPLGINHQLQAIVNKGLKLNRVDIWQKYIMPHIDEDWGISEGAMGNSLQMADLEKIKFTLVPGRRMGKLGEAATEHTEGSPIVRTKISSYNKKGGGPTYQKLWEPVHEILGHHFIDLLNNLNQSEDGRKLLKEKWFILNVSMEYY